MEGGLLLMLLVVRVVVVVRVGVVMKVMMVARQKARVHAVGGVCAARLHPSLNAHKAQERDR